MWIQASFLLHNHDQESLQPDELLPITQDSLTIKKYTPDPGEQVEKFLISTHLFKSGFLNQGSMEP